MNNQVAHYDQSTKLPTVEYEWIGDNEIQTVNARELHKFLEVTTQFKDWITRRIQDYDFEEGKDFCSFLSESSGGRPAKEYALSLDMAKELSMVERNEKGKQARRYFLECERLVKAKQVEIDGSDPRVISAVVDHLYIENKRKDVIIKEQTQQINQLDAILDRIHRVKQAILPSEAAKILQVKPQWLCQYCNQIGWFFKYKTSHNWLDKQRFINAGYLAQKIYEYSNHHGRKSTASQILITPKGLLKLAELIEQHKQLH